MEELKKISEKISKKADRSELFYMNTFRDTLAFEANELKKITNTQNEGLALRIKKNKKIGFAISTRLEDDIIKEALGNAELGDPSELDFTKDKVNFSPEDYRDESIENIEIHSLIEKGEKIIREIREFDKGIKVNINFEKELQRVHLWTSCGFDGNYSKSYYSMFVTAKLAGKNDIFLVVKGFSDRKGMETEEKITKEILSDIEQGINIVKIDRGKYPVLFTHEALEGLFSNFITTIKGDMVFNKISPLHSKLGEAIFDNRITIVDDQTLPGVSNHLPFDDEGTGAQKTFLVEKGILKNLLLDLEYGKKLNMPSTGNGLRKTRLKERSYENFPAICQSTITAEPGNIPGADLLENIEDGLLIKDIMVPFNMNGDLSINVAQGYKIEKGKIKGRVKDTIISVNLFDLLKDRLVEISSDREISSSSEYKLPWMLFKDLNVTC
jgi:PmbA protein